MGIAIGSESECEIWEVERTRAGSWQEEKKGLAEEGVRILHVSLLQSPILFYLSCSFFLSGFLGGHC